MAGTTEIFQGHGGGVRNLPAFEAASATELLGIRQWCLPFLRQHAGRLAASPALASSGCSGMKTVNKSRNTAAHRFTFKA